MATFTDVLKRSFPWLGTDEEAGSGADVIETLCELYEQSNLQPSGPYFKPLNAGIPSETGAACKRVARLLQSLETEVNGYICEGQITEDLRALKLKILDGLKAEGWRVKLTPSDKWSVLPPREVR